MRRATAEALQRLAAVHPTQLQLNPARAGLSSQAATALGKQPGDQSALGHAI